MPICLLCVLPCVVVVLCAAPRDAGAFDEAKCDRIHKAYEPCADEMQQVSGGRIMMMIHEPCAD